MVYGICYMKHQLLLLATSMELNSPTNFNAVSCIYYNSVAYNIRWFFLLIMQAHLFNFNCSVSIQWTKVTNTKRANSNRGLPWSWCCFTKKSPHNIRNMLLAELAPLACDHRAITAPCPKWNYILFAIGTSSIRPPNYHNQLS